MRWRWTNDPFPFDKTLLSTNDPFPFDKRLLRVKNVSSANMKNNVPMKITSQILAGGAYLL